MPANKGSWGGGLPDGINALLTIRFDLGFLSCCLCVLNFDPITLMTKAPLLSLGVSFFWGGKRPPRAKRRQTLQSGTQTDPILDVCICQKFSRSGGDNYKSSAFILGVQNGHQGQTGKTANPSGYGCFWFFWGGMLTVSSPAPDPILDVCICQKFSRSGGDNYKSSTVILGVENG